MAEQGKYQLRQFENEGYFIIETAYSNEYESWEEDEDVDLWDSDSWPPFVHGF